ncbi:MAG: NirD/YgiW/YdeI family stress tolerance protein [Alphaproteobacteria bacterium]|nr:NirD/YgiW/YdeI family stress tolerance protein [Alphaproteobacteria bacterium]
MNKLLSISALSLSIAFSANAMAAFQGPGLASSSVADALKLSDDTAVVLTGQIEKSLGNEKYQFKDATGTVVIEVDNEDWRGVDVKPEDIVIIKGEIDKDVFSTEIDVDSVELKK